MLAMRFDGRGVTEGIIMKFTRCDGSYRTFSFAFAVEYPVLTTASPDQVGI